MDLSSVVLGFAGLRGLKQVHMLAHPVTVASDIDQMAMMQNSIDQSGGHDLVAEHGPPLFEALVRGQHRRSLLVASTDELEEEHRAGATDGPRARVC